MSLTIQELFGASATYNNGTVSFDAYALKDESGNQILTPQPSDSLETPEKVMVALLIYQSIVAKPVRDENDVDITPANRGIVYEDQTFFVGRTFVTREEINQIEHTITIKVYTPDNTGLKAYEVV